MEKALEEKVRGVTAVQPTRPHLVKRGPPGQVGRNGGVCTDVKGCKLIHISLGQNGLSPFQVYLGLGVKLHVMAQDFCSR